MKLWVPLLILAALIAAGGIGVPPPVNAQGSGGSILHNRYFPQLWHVENTGQFGGTAGVDTNARAAWAYLAQATLAPTRIAIVGSGIDGSHETLASLTYYDRWSAFGGDTPPPPDLYGFDTAIAGIIRSVLPENVPWLEIGSYQVSDRRGASPFPVIIEAFRRAAVQNARVILLAGVCYCASSETEEFIESHPEILFVFPSGDYWWALLPFPASRSDTDENVISVSAIDQSGALAYWTNIGASIAAPGANVFAPVPQYPGIVFSSTAGYSFLNGSPFSAASATAVAAALFALKPTATPAEVAGWILKGGTPDERYEEEVEVAYPPATKQIVTSGKRLNFSGALLAAESAPQ